MPMISVIIPIYNAEPYLQRCLESVLSQTFSDFELILVNDGSTDQSGQICDNFAKIDRRIQVIHQSNGGSSVARNNGINAAGGDYLFFVDADDIIHPDCLRVLYQCSQDSGAALSIAAFDRFFSTAFPQANEMIPWNGQWTCADALQVLAMFFDTRREQYALTSACCKLFEASLFREIRFPEGRLFEDQAITYRLFYDAQRIVIVDTVMYYYYYNCDGNMGKLTLQKWFDEYEAQWERLLFFNEHGLEELYDKALLEFLRTTSRNLIACRQDIRNLPPTAMERFEMLYRYVFRAARSRKILDFLRDYDYYVLAKPQWTLWWRVKRQWLLLKGALYEKENSDSK